MQKSMIWQKQMRLSGFLVLVLLVFILEFLLPVFGRDFHDPGILILVIVIYSVYMGGTLIGLSTAATAMLYSAYFFSEPELFTYSTGAFEHLLLLLQVIPVIAIIAAVARHRFKTQERVLRDSEQRYRQLFQDSPVSLWEEDMSDVRSYIAELKKQGISDFKQYFLKHPESVAKCASLVKVVAVNKATLELFEAGREEDLTAGMPSIFMPESYKSFRDELVDFIQGSVTYEVETVNKSLTGKTLYVDLRAALMPGYEESMKRVNVSIVDITKLKQSEIFNEKLNSIDLLLVSYQDFDDMLLQFLEQAGTTMDADSATVYLIENDNIVSSSIDLSEEKAGSVFTAQRLPKLEELTKNLKELLVIDDTSKDERIPEEFADRLNSRAAILAPLIAKNENTGLIYFSKKQVHKFSKLQADFVYKLAISLSFAIENKRAYEKVTVALNDARILASVAEKLNETLDLEKALYSGLEAVLSVMDLQHGCVYVLEGDKLVIKAHRNLGEDFLRARSIISINQSCAGKAVASKNLLIPGRRKSDATLEEYRAALGLDCVAVVPIVAKGNSLGAIEVFAATARHLTDREIRIAETISNQLAAALDNARLYEEERNIADTLQQALLVAPGKIDGVDFGVLYRSATVEAARVGGDFYDIFEIDHNKIGLIVGDVSGKGLEAATLTSMVKNTVKAYAYEGDSPDRIMKKTNTALIKVASEEMLVTIFFTIINKESGVLDYCNAGHLPPLIKRKNSKITMLESNSPALGMFDDLQFIGNIGRLGEGDILVSYTDGITEARYDSTFFGEERLIELVKNLKSASNVELEKILKEVESFSMGKRWDDVILLSISLKKK